jgi:GT2 family glycosyltransferase
MRSTVPIAAIIPTYNRGLAVISVLKKIRECDPKPAEIWIHVDLADGLLERALGEQFPEVRVLASPIRLGPGGGRHRCLQACTAPFAVTFDDDSYPVDPDFFSHVLRLFSEYPRAAILSASIWHRNELAKVRTEHVIRVPTYMGCGCAIRVAAYRQIRGYLPRPVAYGMEENDVSIQLMARDWHIYDAGELRVFHDTDRKHQETPEVTSRIITNVGLYAFLNYPVIGWGLGLGQLANKIAYCIRKGRLRGICSGILHIPVDCYRNRRYRKPVGWKTLKAAYYLRRSDALVQRSETT